MKAHNFCKIPSSGLDEIAQFRDALPAELAARVEISSDLQAGWFEKSEAVVVFGSDETVEHFRKLTQTGQRFVAHGHKVSLGIVFEDHSFESVAGAARNASLFDQQGCLSPHVFYVEAVRAKAYAARLAQEMEAFNRNATRSKISVAESSAIQNLRDDYAFRAANGDEVEIWKSAPGTDWTVVFDAESTFKISCLNRVIFVKPLPQDLTPSLAGVRQHIGTIGIHPATSKNAREAAKLGAERVCAVGEMQHPHFTWHQDGGQNLAPLVRWIDFEDASAAASGQG